MEEALPQYGYVDVELHNDCGPQRIMLRVPMGEQLEVGAPVVLKGDGLGAAYRDNPRRTQLHAAKWVARLLVGAEAEAEWQRRQEGH